MQLFRTLVLLILLLFELPLATLTAQQSVARQWNEVLLQSIRNDLARPTVHARNLFHVSTAMYDAWAAYEPANETFFLGKKLGEFNCPFDGITSSNNILEDQETAISYAAYRLLKHRFKNIPKASEALAIIEAKFIELNYDASFISTDYSNGSAAALGNYIAAQMIEFGLQDGSNEAGDYRNRYYFPQNFAMNPSLPGPGFVFAPNNWQPLSFEVFIDQSGNPIPGSSLEFLGAEWGNVVPFALREDDLTIYKRDGFDFPVYKDPGAPPYISDAQDSQAAAYKWGFNLVAIWSSHLDHTDGVLWDISPGAIGNIQSLPKSYEEYSHFYKTLEGGDASIGHKVNPKTGAPYAPQLVPRGDYARVLAEFWADGPNSETPPGHWFTILNYVNDHPLLKKRFRGEGPILSDLEWDVKAYFALGGTVHDAAVVSWSIKGWYDYIRPISAIRYMSDKGQSSDPTKPRYHPSGIQLVDGYIESVEVGDPLAGDNNVNVGKIKLYAWRGPEYIDNEDIDIAGVGWILAENWWPYQRPTFVTPPFAGYVSGHSTFSRAAAELMTLLTGDAFFPGGMGEFVAKKDEFLVFEQGPSQDITLQWATYRDASDQTSLSRIWGGIHPPADDIPGRLLGEKIGVAAFERAAELFSQPVTSVTNLEGTQGASVYPNPIQSGDLLNINLKEANSNLHLELYNAQGQLALARALNANVLQPTISISTKGLEKGFYLIKLIGDEWASSYKMTVY